MGELEGDRYCIVCGVDFTSASEHAVREAQRLSVRITPSVLHFVHALGVGQSEVDAADADVARHFAGRLEAFVRRALRGTRIPPVDSRAQRVVCHVRREDPHAALVGVARDERADVLVVGARDRPGLLSQLRHGSAVLSLMQHAPAPVLVARERRSVADAPGVPTGRERRGAFVGINLGTPEPVAQAGSIDADSASNLCRLYEARASHAKSTLRACRPGATETARRHGRAG